VSVQTFSVASALQAGPIRPKLARTTGESSVSWISTGPASSAGSTHVPSSFTCTPVWMQAPS